MGSPSRVCDNYVGIIRKYSLVRSQKIPPTHVLLLSAFKILLIRLYEVIKIEELFLKPYCSFANILLQVM